MLEPLTPHQMLCKPGRLFRITDHEVFSCSIQDYCHSTVCGLTILRIVCCHADLLKVGRTIVAGFAELSSDRAPIKEINRQYRNHTASRLLVAYDYIRQLEDRVDQWFM